MITVSCCFAHSSKIMRISQTEWTDVIIPHTSQVLCSGRGGNIKIAYIRWIDGRYPEDFELWAFAEDEIHEFHTFSRVQIRDDFIRETFYSHFFNARKIQIPFLGCIYVNRSVQWLDVPRAALQAESFCCVTTWTENTLVYSWGPYPTVIPPNVSTNRQLEIEDVPVNPH